MCVVVTEPPGVCWFPLQFPPSQSGAVDSITVVEPAESVVVIGMTVVPVVIGPESQYPN